MPDDGIRAKSFADKHNEQVVEGLSGLFSDMFSASNNNTENAERVKSDLEREKQTRLRGRLARSAGAAMNTYAQTQTRVRMMQAMRGNGPSTSRQHGSGDNEDSLFLANEFADMADDVMDDEPELG